MRAGLLEQAEQGELILVCPQGIERHWNDGRPVSRWRAHLENIDDVGFIEAVVDEVARAYPVDRRRIFATGISNGGMMSYRLACERPDLIAAIAPVASSMAEGFGCSPDLPVSVLILNGTDDPLVPYDGGPVGFGRQDLGQVIPTDEVWQMWAKLNQCAEEPSEVWLAEQSPGDGTRVQVRTYPECADGTQVTLFRIEGGGHTWPGGPQYLPERLVGRVSQELDAGRTIWDFFRDQGRSEGV
jgi:polyhydroxybutyrate depolymerase